MNVENVLVSLVVAGNERLARESPGQKIETQNEKRGGLTKSLINLKVHVKDAGFERIVVGRIIVLRWEKVVG
jgi:hypothetical protein